MKTIKDIAKQANVSVGTVDRVLHKRGGVSEKTKDKIERIIKENNFKINVLGRSLALKKKYKVVVLIPSYTKNNSFWKSPSMGILKGSKEVETFGVNVQAYFFNQLDKVSYLNNALEIIDMEPDAVIIAPAFSNETEQIAEKLEANNIPYLFLNIDVEGFENLSFIGQDSYKGGFLAGKLMHLSNGDNALYLIPQIKSEFYNYHVSKSRIQGFCDYFKSKNVIIENIFVNFNNLQDVNLIKMKIQEQLNANKDIKGIYVPSSRISTIVDSLDKSTLDNLCLIGFDTTPQNLECLKNDSVTFLISQKSFNQGYQAVKIISEYLLNNVIPQEKVFSPLEIITKENVEFSQRNKVIFENSEGVKKE